MQRAMHQRQVSISPNMVSRLVIWSVVNGDRPHHLGLSTTYPTPSRNFPAPSRSQTRPSTPPTSCPLPQPNIPPTTHPLPPTPAMRVAILQFAPTLGAVPANLARADALLLAASPRLTDIDLLVLPELAFTGYNFASAEAIRPFLERRGEGASAGWARRTALRLGAVVGVGYAERGGEGKGKGEGENYNSLLTLSATGGPLAHYRKTHLYPTDESWAHESPTGWLTVDLPVPIIPSSTTTPTAFAICMDLNPRPDPAPPHAYDLPTHVLKSGARLLVCSMAWLTHLNGEDLFAEGVSGEPDLATVGWWVRRLRPLCGEDGDGGDGGGDGERAGGGEGPGEVIVVIANRSGEEPGARYAGSSCVLGFGGEGGVVRCWGMLGRGEEGVLVVDTGVEARWRISESGGGGGEEWEEEEV